MNTARTARSTVLVSAVLALSGCGAMPGSNAFLEQSPRDIAKAAFTDMQDITSMRILGSQEGDAGFTRVDIRLDDVSCTGNLDTQDGIVRIIRNSEGAWFTADEKFWRSQASSARRANQVSATYAGAWVAVEEKNPLLELCDLSGLLDGFKLEKGDTEDTIDAGAVAKIGDADAVPLVGRDGKERITVWVAVEAPHRVLKMAPTDDKGRPDALYFEEFGVKVVAKTPPKKNIVTKPGS